MKKISILGAGSWGITLSGLITQASQGASEVWLWDRNAEKINTLSNHRTLTFPVNTTIDERVHLSDNLTHSVSDAELILLVVSSSGTREVLEKIKALGTVSQNTILVNASKGIEYPSLKSMSSVIQEVFPQQPYAILSGPTLAPEIVKGLPTAAVIASPDLSLAKDLQIRLATDLFRLYTNTDVTGVELGGSLKNIFAIVSGYMHAKALGDNAMATLITRGLAEMTRFALARGADAQTLYGLSWFGGLAGHL